MKNLPYHFLKLEVAKKLVRKVFELAGIEYTEENKTYVRLAEVLTVEVGVRISAKAIRDLQSANDVELRKSKEVLAAFALIKEGYMKKSDVKIKVDTTKGQRTIAHNIYFDRYYRLASADIQGGEVKTDKNLLSNLTLIEKELPSYMAGSVWRFYNFNYEGVIYGDIIKILEEKEANLSRVQLINAGPGYYDYFGWVGLDSTSSSIIFHLLNTDSPRKYAHIICSLNPGKISELLLGIVTYISSTDQDLVSTVIALERIPNSEEHLAQVYSSENPAPTQISRLFSMGGVRIAPHTNSVYSLETLRKMLDRLDESEKPQTIRDEILESYCSTYWIYYMYEDDFGQKIIDKVDFEIYFSERSNQVKGNLTITDKEAYTEGEVSKNGSFISAYFTKVLSSGINTRTSYIVFKVGEQFFPEKMECFTGIVSGLGEDHQSAVSYRALFVSKSFKDIEEDWLIKYFSKREWRIETSAPKGFKFDNLELDT